MYRLVLGILFVMASDPIQASNTDGKDYDYKNKTLTVYTNLDKVPIKIQNEATKVILRKIITNITINAFSNFSDCRILRISHKEISRIGPGMFNGLNSLTYLDLFSSKITTIGGDSFSGLTSLRILYLGNNNISIISKKIFSGLVSLEELYLYSNKINDIKDSAFLPLGNLRHLNLSENQLEHLMPNTFSGLVSLEILDLRYNNITDIKDSAFLPLGNLTRLYLFNNQLEHLSMNTFAGLVSLEFLDIGDNKLTTLDPSVLPPLEGSLKLVIDDPYKPSSMVCDIKLCWLKLEANNERIILFYRENRGHLQQYTSDWQSLQCPETIPCRDPGQVKGAERSGYFLPFNNNSKPGIGLPYSTDTEFKYTCDPGYTGGGTITCQSNGQWTRKPECVRLERVVCRAPALVGGYLTPSFDQYENGVKVTYTCDKGLILSGPPDGTCGPDGQFNVEMPSCMKNKAREERKTPIEENGSETTTSPPTTTSPTTSSPTTPSPTTSSPTTSLPTTPSPTTSSPTTMLPTTSSPTTSSPTTSSTTTSSPTTPSPTTSSPTTSLPTTPSPTTSSPTTMSPTTSSPTTSSPTTPSPTTSSPTTTSPTINSPTTPSPTTSSPTPRLPTTSSPTTSSTTTSSTITGSPDQGTKPARATKGVSLWLIYGIVGAVAGIILLDFIGLTIYCFKRSKTTKPPDVDTTRAQDTVTDGGNIGVVAEGNGLYEMMVRGASGASYIEIVNGSHRSTDGMYDSYEQPVPAADRGTSQHTVRSSWGDPWFSNPVFFDSNKKKAALPNDVVYDVADAGDGTGSARKICTSSTVLLY